MDSLRLSTKVFQLPIGPEQKHTPQEGYMKDGWLLTRSPDHQSICCVINVCFSRKPHLYEIVEVSGLFHFPAPFKTQLLCIMFIARFQTSPVLCWSFWAIYEERKEKKNNKKKNYYWECQILLRITAFVGGNNQPQPTVLSIAWGETNLAQPVGN